MQGSFMRQLKSLDPRLGCHQSGNGFNVTYKKENGIRINIMRIDGREPDGRDLTQIRASDIRRESPDKKIKRIAEYMVDERMKDRKRAKDMIRERTVDDKIQLVNAFRKAAGVKSNSAFRRVKEKARGKVY